MLPSLLLVEDDATSRAFLTAACETLPAQVDAAASVAEAMALAQARPHALWLVDARLPDGSGPGLLQRLRALDLRALAVAHTADNSPATRQALLTAGFDRVLVKPLATQTLHACLRSLLHARLHGGGSVAEGGPALWSDADALRALKGDSRNLDALRRLFLDELPGQLHAIDAAIARGDRDTLNHELHRIRASCGFVGATGLRSAAEALHRCNDDAALLEAFREAGWQTLGGA